MVIDMRRFTVCALWLCCCLCCLAPSLVDVAAFQHYALPSLQSWYTTTRTMASFVLMHKDDNLAHCNDEQENNNGRQYFSEKNDQASITSSRRNLLKQTSAVATSLIALNGAVGLAHAADETEGTSSFAASLAEKAAQLSSQIEQQEAEDAVAAKKASASSPNRKEDTRTIYDFKVPVAGKDISVEEMVTKGRKGSSKERPKAVLVVNIKQDDPIARRNIPELIALGAQFGQNGDLAVVCVPTDQGYYEPDTSALIRLKLASEYGYGINPALQLTDKLNLLGNTADPFMRYIQSVCRTPAGLGRIQGNFEKFLVDGQTGKPLRRYPRKYMPRDITDDIEALIKKNPDDENFVLPPAGANFKERWREAAVESERDTYRFQKGLNYFDYEYYEKKES